VGRNPSREGFGTSLVHASGEAWHIRATRSYVTAPSTSLQWQMSRSVSSTRLTIGDKPSLGLTIVQDTSNTHNSALRAVCATATMAGRTFMLFTVRSTSGRAK
jgi:hypothetical protein